MVKNFERILLVLVLVNLSVIIFYFYRLQPVNCHNQFQFILHKEKKPFEFSWSFDYWLI